MDAEEYTDTDKGDTNETCSNYSEEAEFSLFTEDSESEVNEKPPSLTLKRSAIARKHTPIRGKVTSEETPVTPHRENTVEDVQIPGTSARKNAPRRAKVTPIRGKVTSEETPVTPHRENTVENVPGPSAETRRLDRSFSKRSRMSSVQVSQNIIAAKRKSRQERDTSYENV